MRLRGCRGWTLGVALTSLAFGCGKDEALMAGSGHVLGSEVATGGAASEAPAPLTPPDCEQLAFDACQAFETCSPLQLFYAFDTRQACQAQLVAVCRAFAAEGHYIDQNACAAALAGRRCSGFHAARLPTSCTVPRGPGPDAAPCYSDADCESTYCERKDDCGTCSPRRAQGEACRGTVECEPGLSCRSDGCQPPVEAGAGCDDARLCGGNLLCVREQCVEPRADGQRCTQGSCDAFAGSTCEADTERCAPANTAALRDCEPDPEKETDLPVCRQVSLVGEGCTVDDECGKLAFCEDGVCAVTTRRCR
jgi:hypothetical protein